MTSRSDPTLGTFNYLASNVSSSLFRNGEVMIQRNLAGTDSKATGLDYAKTEIGVTNARTSNSLSPKLELNGFELLDAPLTSDLDFLNQQEVLADYYRQCADLVAAHTGARAFAFDHNIRSASAKKKKMQLKDGQEVQGPAHAVHGDYTLTSAPQRLRDLCKPPSANDTLAPLLGTSSLLDEPEIEEIFANNTRFAIINVWRNIVAEPVVMHPMAFCDGQTVAPEDLVVFEIHYSDRIGENYFAKYQPNHHWYYYPEVTRDEAILIKQWDSAGQLAQSRGREADNTTEGPCSFSFHSAFKDPDVPANAPDRWSIEVRCVVLYD